MPTTCPAVMPGWTTHTTGGGSGCKGHRLNLTYQIAKGVRAGVTYYNNVITRTTPETDYNRLQADILIRFK
jgi:hypothetical protein